MRNPLIKAIANARGGSNALARYVAMWRASKVCRATAALWTSAIITPIDCNVKAFEEFRFSLGFAAPELQWKLRPIARPECLLKFAEGVILK